MARECLCPWVFRHGTVPSPDAYQLKCVLPCRVVRESQYGLSQIAPLWLSNDELELDKCFPIEVLRSTAKHMLCLDAKRKWFTIHAAVRGDICLVLGYVRTKSLF